MIDPGAGSGPETVSEPSPNGTKLARRTPLGVEVADRIRRQISSGELAATDELPSESDLATTFGVSQRVVRDALRMLNNEGMVVTRQGKRAIVAQVKPIAVGNYLRFVVDADASSIQELLEFRGLLEGYAARLAAARATRAEIASMHASVATAIAAGGNDDVRVAADLALHDQIAVASGNRFVRAMLVAMSDVLAEERRRGAEITRTTGVGHDKSDALHVELIDAIESGKCDRAERIAHEIVDLVLEHWRPA